MIYVNFIPAHVNGWTRDVRTEDFIRTQISWMYSRRSHLLLPILSQNRYFCNIGVLRNMIRKKLRETKIPEFCRHFHEKTLFNLFLNYITVKSSS